MTPLVVRRFRLNPSYDVRRMSDLDPEEGLRLGGIRFGASYDWVVLPRDTGLSVKVVPSHTAVMLRGLRAGRLLPKTAQMEFRQHPGTLSKFVLDGVLEVEAGGMFVSGAAAIDAMGIKLHQFRPRSRTNLLSLEALRYGQALHCSDGPTLAHRLYGFNRAPVSPRWTQRLGSYADIESHVGLDGTGVSRRATQSGWRAGVAPDAPSWLVWRLRPGPKGGSRFKVYVSPQLEHLGVAIRAALPILTELEVPAFKVGRDLPGVLRPDKFVIYAGSRRQVRAICSALAPALAGLGAQGVPFTAAIDQAGLLSWGIDPPESESLVHGQRTSWRRWLTERLAVALLVAQRQGSPTPVAEPWRFALARIALDGVDARTWLPTEASWVPSQ